MKFLDLNLRRLCQNICRVCLICIANFSATCIAIIAFINIARFYVSCMDFRKVVCNCLLLT